MAVSTSRLENIAVVTIDQPQHRNAVDHATAEQLANAFRRFDADSALHVAILTGAGGHFCAGADLKALADGERRPIAVERTQASAFASGLGRHGMATVDSENPLEPH